MTWWEWILVGLAAWIAVAVILGVTLGRLITRADARSRRVVRRYQRAPRAVNGRYRRRAS
jgi:hypothetical protein